MQLAIDADGIKQAESDGIKAIDAQHQSSQAPAQIGVMLKLPLMPKRQKKTAAIDHDATLTANEKASQNRRLRMKQLKPKSD